MKPLVLLGEARGANEERHQTSFVGAAGIELLRQLDEVGILTLTAEDDAYIRQFYQKGDNLALDMVWRLHPEVYRCNVFNEHPPGNDLKNFSGPKEIAILGFSKHPDGWITRDHVHELERLADELVAQDPNLILALGNTALWSLTGAPGISKLRGTTQTSTHTATGFKLLPTYHPSAVLHQYSLRATVLADLMKAKREQEFPEVRRPRREIWIEPTLDDIRRFINEHITGAERLAVDIETAGNQVTCIGFAPSERVAIVIPFLDERRKDRSYWPSALDEVEAWRLVRSILCGRHPPKTFQNGLYDIAFLWRSVGIATYGANDDTMLLHHALHPESLKALGYLGSIYTDEGAWKQERGKVATIKRDA